MAFTETCTDDWAEYRSMRKSDGSIRKWGNYGATLAERDFDDWKVTVVESLSDGWEGEPVALISRRAAPEKGSFSYYVETLLGKDGYSESIASGPGLCLYYDSYNPENSICIADAESNEIGRWLEQLDREGFAKSQKD